MIRQYKSLRAQRGYLLLVAVILIIVIGFTGAVITELFFGGTMAAASHLNSDSALYLAESGIENAAHELLHPTVLSRSACSGLSVAAFNFGSGAFNAVSTAAPTYSTTAATISTALTATATSLTVNSTTGYATSGRILIDNESINYNSVSGTTFNNLTRGVDGTTATTHVVATRIGQYQCPVQATGGVPNIANATGQRILTDHVQLQEAIAVGDVASNGNFNFGRWNNPTELTWTNPTIAGGTTLNDVTLLSYADGWFVGNTGFVARWTGNIATITTATLTPNVNYRSIFCTASNNCHTVGDVSGITEVIQDWNGTAWTRATATGTTSLNSLRSIHCDSATDCWAVGNNTLTGVFYKYNGSGWVGYAQAALTGYTFNGVFCNSATDCWAVGSTAAFARLTSGTTWANFATGTTAVYNGIYCNSTSDCWAVGNSLTTRDLMLHWNGTAWTRDASNPTPVANLYSVKCTNSNDCWAVGSVVATNLPAFIHWDGTSWTQFAVSASIFTAGTLRGLSIVGPTFDPYSGWQEVFS